MQKSKIKISTPRYGLLTICSLLFTFCSFMGCQGRGGFQDIALVRQAQRELRGIRNALEEYKIDHNTYPSEGSDLKVALAPYLSKAFYFEGEEIPEYTRTVLGAQNNLNQISNAISGCGRIKDVQIKETFDHIQQVFKSYENILSGKDEKIIPIDREILKLRALIDTLNPMGLKSLNQDSLVHIATQIIETADSLIKGAQGTELEHLNNIKNTFAWYKAKFLGESMPEKVELYSPESELSALKEICSESTIVGLQELISSYNELESSRNYYDFLLSVQKDIDKALKLVALLNKEIEKAKKFAVIVQAQASLHRMADAIKDYRRENGKFPDPDANIDSILHPYFIETTMSGEQIDRWEDAISWFSVGPIYKTKNPDVEFELSAQVHNEARTPITSKVRIQNQWDEIIKAFDSPPIYTTPDSTQTYFLKARARDSGLTWVTERPSVEVAITTRTSRMAGERKGEL